MKIFSSFIKLALFAKKSISLLIKFIQHHIPYEAYYRFKLLSKKYYDSMFKHVLVFFGASSFIYIVSALYFKWPLSGLAFLLIFLILLIFFIVYGCLYGEDQKKMYYRDD
jgi:VIT1/CCC1 family predicted Fe2+/Mn2+ transporter